MGNEKSPVIRLKNIAVLKCAPLLEITFGKYADKLYKYVSQYPQIDFSGDISPFSEHNS
jgi:hypothetical protein